MDLALGVSLWVWKLEFREMETDAKNDLLDRLHVAMQRLDETDREFREKLPMFAAGHGPYPTPEEWRHRWQLQATIDRLRWELEQFTARSSYPREGLEDTTMLKIARDRIQAGRRNRRPQYAKR